MRNKSDSAYKKEIEKMSVAELTDTLRPFFLREVDNNYELKSRVTLEEEQIDWISHFICIEKSSPTQEIPGLHYMLQATKTALVNRS